MTINEMANRLATALHRNHSTLIQHYAVAHLEYTLRRELNSMVSNDDMREQDTKNLLEQ